MKLSIFIFGILLFMTPYLSQGQRTPYGLRIDEVQIEIKKELADFDSLVLSDISGYWRDDKTIQGIGHKGNQCFSIYLIFQPDTSSFYDIKIKKSKTKKLKTHECLCIKYDPLIRLSSDSLNLKTRGEVYSEISDQSKWSLFLIYYDKVFLKQAYHPEHYQETVPTEERELFMRIVSKLEGLNRRSAK